MPDFRKHIENIIEALRKSGMAVFAALEDEGWKLTHNVPPEVGVQKDVTEINVADVVVALVQDKPSTELQFEIGYAVAKEKRVILARRGKEDLAYFNQGVVRSGLATLITYEDVPSLINQLIKTINTPVG